MAKSVTVAYILWFFLGTFGVHHFYLRRDRHAFCTCATLGGFFWIGWLRDLFCIPQYVADVNESPEYMRELIEDMNRRKQPNVSSFRFMANIAFGYMLALLTYCSLWNEDFDQRYLNALAVVAHLAAGIGVYFISNEGRHQVSLLWCLFGSLCPLPFTISSDWSYIIYSSIAAAIVASRNVEWRRQPRTDGFCKRIFRLTTLSLIYTGLIGVSMYYNVYITTSDGESVPLREAAQNFFKSPAWKETKDAITQLYNYYKAHGWKHIYEQIIDIFDPQGEANAYEVLKLNKSASQEEIKASYKKLAREWHPDKVKDAEKKQIAQEKFMEIQEAYSLLSNIQQSRARRNKNAS